MTAPNQLPEITHRNRHLPPEETRFKPGVSGNPGGRPKGLARRVKEEFGHDGDGLVEFLAGIVVSDAEKTTDRLEAARILLERGWGKAPIALDTDGQPTQFVLVSAFGATVEEAA